MTTQQYIELIANTYFWVFILIQILTSILVFSDKYKESELNSIKNGTYLKDFNINPAIFRWVLFILSIHLS